MRLLADTLTGLNAAVHHGPNNQNDKQQAQATAGIVAPARAVRENGQAAQKREYDDDQQDGSKHSGYLVTALYRQSAQPYIRPSR